MPRLTWSRQPSETGLRAIGQGPRGWILKVDGVKVGSVAVAYNGFSRDIKGWYFVTSGNGIPWKNTAAENVFYPDADAAKVNCKEYVVGCLTTKEPA